jgi:hypothetical protein
MLPRTCPRVGYSSLNDYKFLISLPNNGHIFWNMTMYNLVEVYFSTRRYEVTPPKIVSTLHSHWYDKLTSCKKSYPRNRPWRPIEV